MGRDDLFLSDLSAGQDRFLHSPKVLLALLICTGCPVCPQCLAESLRRLRVPLSDEATTEAPAAGVWGGSTEWDRRAVRHLPTDEAAQELERTFPERLARRAAAFEDVHSDGHCLTQLGREVQRMLMGELVRDTSGQRASVA